MTSFINWPVIASLYPNLYFSTDGMSVAGQPWSGNYRIGKATWATAHTTQFTAPGWHYIDSASGYLGGARTNGSYVTLKSTNNTDYSSVIETMDATAAQTATFTVSGGLSTGKVHVWATNLKSSDPADYFVHTQDVTPTDGAYSLTLQPGYVYTVTTTTGQGKGTATPPKASALALPYSDDFETPAASTSPKYFADMNGAFATAACGGGRSGTCLRQMAATAPINWTHESYHAPYTIMGDGSWSNYTVRADTLFEQAGTAEVLGRVGKQGKNNQGLDAYHLQVSDTGAWSIQRSDVVPDPNNSGSTTWSWTKLASGTVTALGTNTWHSLALTMQGSKLTAAVDGKTVGSATDATYTSGQAGLGVTGYQTDEFDNFALTPGTASAADRPGHLRRVRQVPRRQRGLHRERRPRPDLGLQLQRRPEVELEQRHPADQRQVRRRHRSGYGERHPGRPVGLQRRRQPAVDPAGRRHPQGRTVRTLPRRAPRHFGQRHPAGDLGLQRRVQPAVDPAVIGNTPRNGRRSMRVSRSAPTAPTVLASRWTRVLAGTACAFGLVWACLPAQAEAALTGAPATTAAAATPVYLNTAYSFPARAADLVSRMTFAEKAAQLNVRIAPAIPRLGVQDYTYWSEGAHGINYLGAGTNNPGGSDRPPATSFPVNFASAMTWDKDLMYKETTAVSDEVRGYLDKSLYGVAPNNIGQSKTDYGSLTFWAPTVNMDRDPRWGRNDEDFGEDPYLVGQMGGAFVNGYQGNTESGQPANGFLKVAATAKHFALNDVENMRKASDSMATDTDIRDYYTAQFKSLVEDSHVAGLMTSYNAVNGTPAVANTYTDNQIAQRTYGFSGYTTSDCGAVATVYDLPTAGSSVAGHNWAPPGWTTDGLGDNSTWTNTATGAKISAKAGAQAYALRAGTYVNCDGGENTVANLQAAINVGLLSDGVIDTALTRVFTMRMATGEFDPPSSVPYTSITKANIEDPAHQALAEQVAANDLVLLKNDKPASATAPLLPLNPAKLNNVVILGDMANTVTLGGYSGTPTHQASAVQGLTSAIKAANPGANILFDAAGTSSTATSAATLSASTQAAIKKADLVLLFAGTNLSNATENVDRKNLDMPGNYRSLITQTTALGNPKTALVLQSNGPVKIDDVQAPIPSILFSGYNGQSQGTALADVMFGKQNPTGHLDFTWYKDDSQLPAMSNYGLAPDATGGLGRTYQFFTGTPTYPFGYGLSYTNFGYSPAIVDKSTVTADGTVDVSFTVTNTGTVSGAAVAQLYAATPKVTPPAGTTAVPLPMKRLAGFQKTQVLAPGASQKITLPVKIARPGLLGRQGDEVRGLRRDLPAPGRFQRIGHRLLGERLGHRSPHPQGAVRHGAARGRPVRRRGHDRPHRQEPLDQGRHHRHGRPAGPQHERHRGPRRRGRRHRPVLRRPQRRAGLVPQQ